MNKIKIPVAYILQSNRMIKIIEMIESLKLNYTRRCLRKNIKQDERDWDPRGAHFTLISVVLDIV